MSRVLPFKQRKFVANYILLAGNGSRAVLAAGYKQTYGSARVTSHRLLTKANVMSEIESHVRKSKMSADQVIEELSDIAQVNTPIEATQKVKALELLGKFHKLFVDKIEQTSTVTTIDPISIQRSIDKIASKTNQPKSIIAQEFLAEWSNKDDPDYDPALHHAIQEIVNSLPVEQIPEQISESSLEQ